MPFSEKIGPFLRWNPETPLNGATEEDPTVAPRSICSADLPRDAKDGRRITVECKGNEISISADKAVLLRVKDDRFPEGYVGMEQAGYGRKLFRHLDVESLKPE